MKVGLYRKQKTLFISYWIVQEVELVRKKVWSDTGEAEVKLKASDSIDRSPIGQAVCFLDHISSVFGPERDWKRSSCFKLITKQNKTKQRITFWYYK